VRCGNTFEDNDPTILRGCKNCGSIFFLYMKSAEDAQQIKQIENELKAQDTTLEKELTKKIEEKKMEIAVPVVEEKIEVAQKIEKEMKTQKEKFGVETVKVPREGVYEINLEALMGRKPLIILEKGRVYFIHLPSAFEKVK
jgi:predicted  nucleic acid-binding Zn-ribbon protein